MLNVEKAGLILHTERYRECVAFYRDVIGLPIEFEKNEPQQMLTCLKLGGSYLMLEGGGSAKSGVKSTHENPVTIRLNVPDVDAAAEHLRSLGVDVLIMRFDWGTIGKFADPDGNPCQLRDHLSFASQSIDGVR
ncbi:VOC family protein [Inquilinus limosus]|uniref:VOC family protein n=1 Tax=Inquilinus limosus TaxID=171674 RepID=UPI003F163A3C